MMLEMFNASIFTVAEAATNALIRQDPVTLQRLSKLSGKIIEVRLQEPDFNFTLIPSNDGFQLHQTTAQTADVCLLGRPSDFIKLITSKEKAQAMFGQGVTVTGDSGLATELQQILQQSHIDWEGQLASLIGSLPAHQISNLVNFRLGQYQALGSSVLQNLDEYIREESELLAPRPMVDHFFNEVDHLRSATDRLSARLQRLKSQIEQPSKQD